MRAAVQRAETQLTSWHGVRLSGLQLQATAEHLAGGAIRLRVLVTKTSARNALDDGYAAAFERYSKLAAARGLEAAGDPPVLPGTVLQQLNPVLVGSHSPYTWRASTGGGGKSEWAGEWWFEPTDPGSSLESATRIRMHTDDGEIELAIESPA